MLDLITLFPGVPGGPELLVVLFVVVLLFGANKLPELARSSGRAMGEFRRGREEIEHELRASAGAASDAAAVEAERGDSERASAK